MATSRNYRFFMILLLEGMGEQWVVKITGIFKCNSALPAALLKADIRYAWPKIN